MFVAILAAAVVGQPWINKCETAAEWAHRYPHGQVQVTPGHIFATVKGKLVYGEAVGTVITPTDPVGVACFAPVAPRPVLGFLAPTEAQYKAGIRNAFGLPVPVPCEGWNPQLVLGQGATAGDNHGIERVEITGASATLDGIRLPRGCYRVRP